jgi:two-component system sensor histidine kinase UhpB
VVVSVTLRSYWYNQSVRTQLLVVVSAINIFAAVLTAGVGIFNTRVATRVEIEASLELAQRFVAATLKDLAAEDELHKLEEYLPLQLKHLRHVRIMLVDAFGKITILSPQHSAQHAATWVPGWFDKLVRPKLAQRTVRVMAGSGQPLIIVGEPADEIAEAWQDFYALALLWLVLNAAVLGLLYLVLGRILDPLANLSRGMLNLEDGKYATRLREPKVKELALITSRFNMLAGALAKAKEENTMLNQRLITIQEQERREIANELHDEAGSCLFGITANASSIKTLADQMSGRKAEEIAQRVDEILVILERLKTMNRLLLKKLRPAPLGRATLMDLLDELIIGFRRRHPDTQIISSLQKMPKSYGEAIDLTLFRCIQEGLTNAIRHGRAASIFIEVKERSVRPPGSLNGSRPQIDLLLRDDGNGFAPPATKGFGLTAMTERVRALGGTCAIDSAPSAGTSIRVIIPIEAAYAERLQLHAEVGHFA